MLRKTFQLRLTVLLCLTLALSTLVVAASTAGFGVGLDPTGLLLISALAELPIGEFLDLRAQVGFSTAEIEGLMLASIDLLAHQLFPPVDPYIGIGIGAALTPPPFTTGLVVEGMAGTRIIAFEPVALFLQARFLLRYSGGVWTTGPVFEGGILIRF